MSSPLSPQAIVAAVERRASIEAPGVYDMPADAYHADPCPQPSLSASVAHELLSRSPRHAWQAHPRLNPAHEPEHRTEFDLGHAAHALVLGDERRFQIIDAADYRTAAAKAAREAAYSAGAIPLLPHQYEAARAMARALRAQLEQHEARDAFTQGQPERTIAWREGGLWMRARLDWWPATIGDQTIIYDFKSTTNAEPAAWSRAKIEAMGFDLQAAFYLRGMRALGYPASLRFAFVVAEVDAPHALSVVGLPPAVMALGDDKVEHAIALWRRCVETNTWPGYPSRICWAEPNPWSEARWQERQARDPKPRPPALEAAMAWQAPLEAPDGI